MAKRDYYEVMGLSRNATNDDIRKSFRERAKELHPDRNKDDPTAADRFKELNEAYDVLKDAKKRETYDRFGHAAFDQTMGGDPGAGFQNAGTGDFGSAFSDIFDDLFGDFVGGRRGAAARGRGSDLRYNLTIDLEDAFNGKQVTINAPGSAICEACSGTGSADGSPPTSCPTCSGIGKVRAQQGFFTIERTCPTCHGRGQIIRNPCRVCNGTGQVEKERSLSVPIPAGVEDGLRIRLAGQGEPGMGNGPPGDLYIFVSIRPHDLFRRDGADLICEVTVPFVDAAVGGSIEVPTLDGGKTKVAIPAGTQSGKQLRLRSKGMPVLRSTRIGDLYLELNVETPQSLTPEQIKLLKAFGENVTASQNPQTEAYKGRVRAFWERAPHGE